MLFRFSLATVALLGFGTASVFAQATNENPPPSQAPKKGPVALVDVGAIIKAHPTMNAEMEKIKAEMETAHNTIENRRKALLAESETIVNNYDPNTPDFKQKQEELLNKESKLRVDFLGQEKEFAEKQAKVVFSSYSEINSAIAYVANGYGYDVVLRYSKEQDEMDPKKPQSVNFGLQRDVLFQAPGLDITEHVLWVLRDQYIKKGIPINATAPTKGAAPQVAQPPIGSNNNGLRR